MEWRPMKAIRAKCLDCSCGNPREVERCHIQTCALWPYRMGTKPEILERRREKRRARQAVTAHE